MMFCSLKGRPFHVTLGVLCGLAFAAELSSFWTVHTSPQQNGRDDSLAEPPPMVLVERDFEEKLNQAANIFSRSSERRVLQSTKNHTVMVGLWQDSLPLPMFLSKIIRALSILW
mmetsp:Transcript_18446/g.53191  ORF Transcript_18446/g.53191 Transcript_18446/m.53191 type:complete len:114 (+) Transcript_18446:111-452(+)